MGPFQQKRLPNGARCDKLAGVMDPGTFGSELLARFPGCHTTPGGEVWVPYEDALSAVDLAERLGFPLLGMEGFLVGPKGVFPSMSRIKDYSRLPNQELAYERARAVLIGEWASIPDDLHPDAFGRYVIDLVVGDSGSSTPPTLTSA